MKTLKMLATLLVLVPAGCGEATDMISAHAGELNTEVRCQYSGAGLTYKVNDGQVFEYSSSSDARVERKAAKLVFAVLDGQVHEYH
jgi:hypothetical protein